ncbi:hypothetical protein [Terribacillus aidingensis]|uniref:hypothetical protein n=1 Tax=Terribacillus aidingensis TaxID=586416 RepID=UPI00344D33FE
MEKILSHVIDHLFFVLILAMAVAQYYPDSVFGIFRNNVIAFAVLIGIIFLNHVSSKLLHASSSIGEPYFIRGLGVLWLLCTILNLISPDKDTFASFDTFLYWILIVCLIFIT